MLKPSTYQPFTINEEAIHHLMLHTAPLKRNGLLYGKLGITIAFFEWGNYWHNSIFSDYAIELKNSLPNKIDNNIPLDFAIGLCGFGWGIEYLAQHQFVDSNSTGVCANIDQKIMAMDMRRITDLSLENGLEGFLHYILIRLNGAKIRESSIPFDHIFLKDTYNRLQSLPEEDDLHGLCNLKQIFITYMDTSSLSYKPEISSFINNLAINSESDILSAKLGLTDGLAGKLVKIISGQS